MLYATQRLSVVSLFVAVTDVYSENVPKAMFGASAVTDEPSESENVQSECPDWYVWQIARIGSVRLMLLNYHLNISPLKNL